MLFTAAVILNGQVDTYIICSDSNDKGKHTVLAFIDHLYDHILKEGPEADGEVIWTDGPSSKFKNKYMTNALEILSKKHKRSFSWKYFAKVL